jgi:hypothetical protein
LKSLKTVRTEEERAWIDVEIGAILAGEEELIPSSGFLASVMERVEQEAALPAPIPFPWKRVLAGILAATGVFGWGAVKLARLGPPAVNLGAFALPHEIVALVPPAEQMGWVAMALGVSLLSWLLARRLADRGGLL